MRGGNTIGLRAFNERLVVDAIMRGGALSKADVARVTGLSGQAAAVIVNHLIGEGLLTKGEKVRGQVGQPSTPITIDPAGAYGIGVGIGRRRVEAAMITLRGEVVGRRRLLHDAPEPKKCLDAARTFARELLDELDRERRHRVVGLGVSMPGDLHAWSSELGLAEGGLDGWKTQDTRGALEQATGLPTTLLNDAMAACTAELVLGDAIVRQSALYIYIGTFIGAGPVLDGKLFHGAFANAGAIGSMPTCRIDETGRPAQLIRSASIFSLEALLRDAGCDLETALAGEPSPAADAAFAEWLETATQDLSRAVVTALSVIDFETIVIDGLLPPEWRRRTAQSLRAALNSFDLRGLRTPEIATGSIGPSARVMGAALLPLKARFSPDPALLVG